MPAASSVFRAAWVARRAVGRVEDGQPLLVSSSVLMRALLQAALPCDEYGFGGRYHNKTFLHDEDDQFSEWTG